MVGIPRSVAEALDARGEKWRINGRYVVRRSFLLTVLIWKVSILNGLNAYADMPLFRLFRAGMYDVLLLTGEE